jgi:hypothetical protein
MEFARKILKLAGKIRHIETEKFVAGSIIPGFLGRWARALERPGVSKKLDEQDADDASKKPCGGVLSNDSHDNLMHWQKMEGS